MSATTLASSLQIEAQGLSDEQVVGQVREGRVELFEIIMRRHNRRLFRAAVSILKNVDEAEDVVQEAFVRAFEKIAQFEGRAALSTWLTKIAVHEAFKRRRNHGRLVERDALTDQTPDTSPMDQRNPEHSSFVRELREGLEDAILSMPEDYRTVFVLRQVESMSTSETAAALELTEGAVKTRLHRANHWLQKELAGRFMPPATEAFPFAGERCDRIVKEVLRRISGPKFDL